MNIVSHLCAGWALAEAARLTGRERAAVALASVAPDLDGAGMLVDAFSRLLGRGMSDWYENWHHFLGHGLPAALAITGLAWAATRRAWVALLAFASVHLHLLMDLAGSRGSNPLDIWPIAYLAPFSERLSFEWGGQWPLTGWQNTGITAALMALVLALAVVRGASPVVLLSARADAVLVATLRARWEKLRGR